MIQLVVPYREFLPGHDWPAVIERSPDTTWRHIRAIGFLRNPSIQDIGGDSALSSFSHDEMTRASFLTPDLQAAIHRLSLNVYSFPVINVKSFLMTAFSLESAIVSA